MFNVETNNIDYIYYEDVTQGLQMSSREMPAKSYFNSEIIEYFHFKKYKNTSSCIINAYHFLNLEHHYTFRTDTTVIMKQIYNYAKKYKLEDLGHTYE